MSYRAQVLVTVVICLATYAVLLLAAAYSLRTLP